MPSCSPLYPHLTTLQPQLGRRALNVACGKQEAQVKVWPECLCNLLNVKAGGALGVSLVWSRTEALGATMACRSEVAAVMQNGFIYFSSLSPN